MTIKQAVVAVVLAVATSARLTAQSVPGPQPAQLTGAPAAAFEVASIRPSAPLNAQTKGGLSLTQRQARFVFMSLKDYIGLAFNMRVHQIVGPDWLSGARFDIAATIPEGVPTESLPSMVKTLLEERFKLHTHREQREFPAYALEVLPNAKLVPIKEETDATGVLTVTSGANASGGTTVDLGQGSSLVLGDNRFDAKKVTMVSLADMLGRFVDKPVVDMTKLDGRYDIRFELQPQDFQAMMLRSAVYAGIQLPPQAMQLVDNASPAAVVDALRAVGLALNPRRLPFDVLVIDSIEKMPTDN